MRITAKIGLVALIAGLLPISSATHAGEKLLPAGHVTPRDTRVLLLPPLDVTPDARHMLAARSAVVWRREDKEFITRQFEVLGEPQAARAAEETPRIGVGDLSARTARNLDLLAKRTGADWVVGIAVLQVKGESSAGDKAFEVKARILLQVWDARRHGWLADGAYTGQDRGGGSPIFLFRNSLDEAVKGSLGKLLNATTCNCSPSDTPDA